MKQTNKILISSIIFLTNLISISFIFSNEKSLNNYENIDNKVILTEDYNYSSKDYLKPIINKAEVNVDTKELYYDISLPETPSGMEPTFISKIEVLELGVSYGFIEATEDSLIPLVGKMDLDVIEGQTYSGLDFEVTYNEGNGVYKDIPTFTISLKDALPPIINNIDVDVDSKTLSYSITIPNGDSLTKNTIISKIEVTNGIDSFGVIEATQEKPIDSLGIINLNVLEGKTYEDLYLEVTYNEGNKITQDIPVFTVSLKDALPPIIANIRVNYITEILYYSIFIPRSGPLAEETVISKIEITNGSNSYGWIEATEDNPIESRGSIELYNMVEGQVYRDLYLEVTYNEENKVTKDIPKFTIPWRPPVRNNN